MFRLSLQHKQTKLTTLIFRWRISFLKKLELRADFKATDFVKCFEDYPSLKDSFQNVLKRHIVYHNHNRNVKTFVMKSALKHSQRRALDWSTALGRSLKKYYQSMGAVLKLKYSHFLIWRICINICMNWRGLQKSSLEYQICQMYLYKHLWIQLQWQGTCQLANLMMKMVAYFMVHAVYFSKHESI